MLDVSVNAGALAGDLESVATAVTGCDLFTRASLGGDEDVDRHGISHCGERGFEAPRIADAAFRVVHKAQERCATALGAIVLGIDPELLGEVFGGEARARFLDEHRQPIVVQQECRARGSFRITRRPFVRADIVELEPQ
ncbi:MAG: hypothetical protein RL042_2321 [Nitrospirota bacterium]